MSQHGEMDLRDLAQRLCGPVLLVEDNPMIAIDTRHALRELGATSVVLAATLNEALAALDDADYVVAVLDLKLGQESCLPAAHVCVERGIPFIFASGFVHQDAVQVPFANVPILMKPYDSAGLARALGRAFEEE